ncbi:MAG: dimethyl sulfoxide reductase anchor subunit [Betaproteobacteria bacterium]|nr:dimethyl sulfoxide reductase anchor subunit [Betaproteobacteria bacterium]
MNPAWSVILLTTLIGAGQGLFLALYTVQSYALVGLVAQAPPAADDARLVVWGSALALVLLGAGLFASFFHLGRPERAWRSAAMWRTSWLSREVIVLPAFMGALAVYGALHAFGIRPVIFTTEGGLAIDLTLAAGTVAALLAFALFVCTGMIYACLRFLAEWHTPLTPLNFVLMGAASGFTLAAALAAAMAPARVPLLAGWALVLTALAFIGRSAALARNARLKPRSTIQSAIGVKHPRIVQRSAGFMGSSFNTREFFHRARPAVLRAVKPAFIVLAFALPLVLLAAARAAGMSGMAAGGGDSAQAAQGSSAAPLLMLAFAAQFAGLLAERWFFFAQARHPQNLYYQAVS